MDFSDVSWNLVLNGDENANILKVDLAMTPTVELEMIKSTVARVMINYSEW